jgi:hypothetical protein
MTPLSRYSTIAFAVLLTTSIGAETRKPTPKPTDLQIETKVQAALNDPAFHGSSILSSVQGGVVTLNGNVRSEAEKELASQDLANIAGVKTVLNNLSIVDHTPKPAAATVPPAGPSGPKVLTLAEGTNLSVRLMDEINTKTAKAGDTFHGTTASNLMLLNYTAIPTGTPVTGRIVEAKPAGRLSGAAELTIELVSVRLNSGNGTQEVSLATQQLSSKANGRGANTAEKAGGGAALGAVVGALAGGGAGAGIGAVSGGALGLGANVFTHGKEIDLKPEQVEQFRTAAPLEVTIMLQNGKQVQPSTESSGLQARPVSQ